MPVTQAEAKGFFTGLFDFGFTSFITLKFLRVIYTVLVVVVLLVGAVLFLLTVTRGGIYGVLAFFVIPLVTLFHLVLVRLTLETVAVLFRIGENTALLAAAARAGVPAGRGTGRGVDPGLPGPYSGPVFPSSRPMTSERTVR